MDEAQFERRQMEILDRVEIPEEFRDYLKNFAWREAHSGGHYDVLSVLQDLAYGLSEPIKTHRENTLKEFGTSWNE